MVGIQVLHHYHGHREIGRQARKDHLEGVDTAGGGSHTHDFVGRFGVWSVWHKPFLIRRGWKPIASSGLITILPPHHPPLPRSCHHPGARGDRSFARERIVPPRFYAPFSPHL